MKNPIPRAGLWVTPETYDELTQRVEDCTSKWDAMMLTLNFCRKLVDDELTKQAVDAE
jgi:hypothetical protein